MKFRFLDVKVPQVAFKHSEKLMEYLYALEKDDHKNYPHLEFNVVTPPGVEKEKIFFILFKIRIDQAVYSLEENEEDDGIFIVNLICRFKTNKLIEDGFGKTDLASISAPQAAYPFVRSWISNFFTQNGFDAVYFPIYDFNKSKDFDEAP